jgi:hypothetical protein
MKRKRILERFDEFMKTKLSNEETNITDDEIVDEVDSADSEEREDKPGKKIKTKELSDDEMNDENIGDLIEEIKQYLKKNENRYGR